MSPATKKILIATLRADNGISDAQIARVLAVLEGKDCDGNSNASALAVNQARVGEMLDCSRFHVRKLVELGLLRQRNLAGLNRYAVADVMKLLGGTES